MTTTYEVALTDAALADLRAIRDWIRQEAGQDVADRFLDGLLARIDALERFPERGSIPNELVDLDDTVRQTSVPPYRLIYEVVGRRVNILAAAHARRDLEALLAERLRR